MNDHHYQRPAFLFNNHFETIYPAIFRKINDIKYEPERISTPDGDFLDLNWVKTKSKDLVILSHGLEGNSNRGYIRGMAKAFSTSGFDVLAWDYRGCGVEMNLKPRFYHTGATDDLELIVQHALRLKYNSINLIGFSLGGNITLKFLGEHSNSLPYINKAVAISVPLYLDSSCAEISKKSNWIYSFRFLRSLKQKVRAKSGKMKLPNFEKLDQISSIREFDNWITGPLHGFKDAADYYSQCSSIHFIPSIKTPTLIINAKNDPFLSKECFPSGINSNYIEYLYPDYGGHVGFTFFNKKNLYWSELMALKFITGKDFLK